jgi:hypothetical protein
MANIRMNHPANNSEYVPLSSVSNDAGVSSILLPSYKNLTENEDRQFRATNTTPQQNFPHALDTADVFSHSGGLCSFKFLQFRFMPDFKINFIAYLRHDLIRKGTNSVLGVKEDPRMKKIKQSTLMFIEALASDTSILLNVSVTVWR